MTNQDLKHETLVLERLCAAPVERVFAAFADPEGDAPVGAHPRRRRRSSTTRSTSVKAVLTSSAAATSRILNIAGPPPITTLFRTSASFQSETVETERRKLLISMATTSS